MTTPQSSLQWSSLIVSKTVQLPIAWSTKTCRTYAVLFTCWVIIGVMIGYDAIGFAFKNWQTSCHFNLAHKLKRTVMRWVIGTGLEALFMEDWWSTDHPKIYKFNCKSYFYLRQGSNVFARFCLFVCLCVSKITQKVMDGSFWNFLGMSVMAKTTSGSISGVIWKESWILDHFEIFVNIAFNGA